MSEPLTWDKITGPSKLMLPAYIGLFSVLGVVLAFVPYEDLQAGPILIYANSLPVNLVGWGWMFMVTAAFMIFAILTRRRVIFRYALWIGAITLLIWTGVALAAAIWG